MKSISIKNKVGADKRGFSLAESLITILLMSIVLVTISSGASVIQGSYFKITTKANAMTLLSTVTMAIDADLKSAESITREEGGTIWFYSDRRDAVITFPVTRRAQADSIIQGEYRLPNSSNTETFAVVSAGAYGDKLAGIVSEFDFDESKNRFHYVVKIYKKTDLANEIEEAEVYIQAANLTR